jgi:hypothetical protein
MKFYNINLFFNKYIFIYKKYLSIQFLIYKYKFKKIKKVLQIQFNKTKIK